MTILIPFFFVFNNLINLLRFNDLFMYISQRTSIYVKSECLYWLHYRALNLHSYICIHTATETGKSQNLLVTNNQTLIYKILVLVRQTYVYKFPDRQKTNRQTDRYMNSISCQYIIIILIVNYIKWNSFVLLVFNFFFLRF